MGFCIDGQDTNRCYSYKTYQYRREIRFNFDSDTVNFFCGGIQGFNPSSYISYSGYSYVYIKPRIVPPGSPIDTSITSYWGATYDLQIPGQYMFLFYTVSPSGNICSDTTRLYVNVSSLENPSAGTSVIDSICNIDTIIIVGSLPINQNTGLVDPNAVVLWQQISGPNTVTFLNPANSQLVSLIGFQAGTYTFVYSFSLDPTCYLADTMTITLYPCDTVVPPQDSCVSIVNDSIWCNGSGYFMHFCVHNNAANTWNLNSFQLVTPPGVSVSSVGQPAGSGFQVLAPQYYYFYNLPSTAPGATLCDFIVQVSGVTSGQNLCLYIIGHDEDTIPSLHCCLDSSNVACLTVPTCRDTCGYISDSFYCVAGVLYYSYTIHNLGNFTIDGYTVYMKPPAAGATVAAGTVSIPPMANYTGAPINMSSYGLAVGSNACFYARLFSTHMLGGVPCIDTICWTDTNCLTVPNCNPCCGTWGTISFTYYPPTGGPPVSRITSCGATIPYNCAPLANMFNFIYNCSGHCATSFTGVLYNPSNAPVWSSSAAGTFWGINGNLLPFTSNGTYRLVVYAYCGGHLCDSCVLYIRRDCHSTCCGTWGTISYTRYPTAGGPPVSQIISCGTSIPYNCPPLQNMYNFNYTCSSSTCATSFTGTLLNPSNTPVWSSSSAGTFWGINGNLLPFTTNGAYTLVVYAYCEGHLCDSCKIRIVRECVPCCGEWGHLGYSIPAGGSYTGYSCGATIDLDCNQSMSILNDHFCVGTCSPSMTSYLYNPSGTLINSTSTASSSLIWNLAGTNFTLSGTYRIVTYAYCGHTLCDSCILYVNVLCEPCCGEWGHVGYSDELTHHTYTPYTCGDDIHHLCGDELEVINDYFCKAPCGTTMATHVFDPYGNDIASYTVTSTHLMWNIPGVNFTTSGHYRVVTYAYCGGKICDSCVLNVYVECPECCGAWDKLYYLSYDGHGSPISTSMKCGDDVLFNCPPLSNIYTFQYICSGECLPRYEATLYSSGGVPIWTGSYTGTTYNIGGLPIYSNGVFTLRVDVYCGGHLCNHCEINIVAHCHFPDCCGEWDKNYMDDYSNPHGPISRVINCGETYAVDCIHNYNFLFNYKCKEECPTSYYVLLDAPDGSTSTYTYVGTSLSYNHLFTMNGTYRLHVFVYCGGTLCSECVIYLNADCGHIHEARARKSNPNTAPSDAIAIFPNPALDHISISTLLENIKLVEVLDLQGRIVYSKSYSDELRNTSIDVSSLSSGSYIIRVNNSTRKSISIAH